MTRPEADPILTWLSARQRFGVRLGLDRMEALLDELGRPQRTSRQVLVGGTNGKGSTATVLAAALAAGGERVGLYTSPHLQRLGARVRIGGRPVEQARLLGALARVRPRAERLEATYFEVLTAAALLLFAEEGVDTAVLEVGLCGRFDATNAVDPALSLVTGVALDHVAVLGGTLAAIAREKAGILRPGVPAWTGAEGEGLDHLRQAAASAGVRLRSLEHDAELRVRDRGWEGLALDLRYPGGRLSARTPLVGAHQARNVALALVGAVTLGVPPDAAVRGAADARWPGRLERLDDGSGPVVLDGAHNPASASALAAALRSLEGRVPVLVLGVSADKDVAGIAAALAGVAERVIATRAVHSPRALAPEALSAATGADAAAPDPRRALAQARRLAGPGGTVVVAGSLFLVGEARGLLLGEESEEGERWQ